MKKKRLLFIPILIFILGSFGCGKEKVVENNDQKYEYTHINTMFLHIFEEKMPIGDWGYGKENESSHGDRFNVDAPVFSIHVNPFANDELLNLYVENLMIIDRHMGANDEYLKYIKKNHPYYVSFDCLGKDIVTVEIDGQNEFDSVMQQLSEAIIPCHEDAKSRVENFEKFIKDYDGINVAENGEYYFVIDSENVTDSIAPVMKSIDEINDAFPFSEDEMSGLFDSFSYLGNIGGGFQVYFDEYGNDPLLKDDLFDFSYTSYLIYSFVYNCFVPTGSFDAGTLRTYYYCNIREEGNKVFGGYENNQAMSEEEICDVLWNLYYDVTSKHKEHGIKLSADLELGGSCMLTESNAEGPWYQTNMVIPVEYIDEPISREMFDEMFYNSSRYFDPIEYMLPE